MSDEDKKTMAIIHTILNKGHDAEVKKNKDGTIKVLEVKKKICAG